MLNCWRGIYLLILILLAGFYYQKSILQFLEKYIMLIKTTSLSPERIQKIADEILAFPEFQQRILLQICLEDVQFKKLLDEIYLEYNDYLKLPKFLYKY